MLQHAASLFEAIGGVLKPVDLPMRVCGAIAGAERCRELGDLHVTARGRGVFVERWP